MGDRVVVSARPARALTSGAARRRRDVRRPGVIVVRQGNRAVLLRRVRSRRRPQDRGASSGDGTWQARRARGRRQRAGHAPHPAGRRHRGAGAGAGLRRAQLLLRLVRGRQVPLVRAGRELGRAAVEDRRQGARRRALRPGAHAEPGDDAGRELHSAGARQRDDGLGAQAAGQDQGAGAPALPAAGAAVPHARAQDLEAALKVALAGAADTPPTEAQRTPSPTPTAS